MSRRAAELGAVNVGQGFPDYPIDPDLAACVTDAVAAGFNQYAPMEGSVALRAAIAAKIAAAGGRAVDPETELTVTCGGTESIYSAIQAVVGPGRRSHRLRPGLRRLRPGDPARRRALHPHSAARRPDFRYDWDRVRASLSTTHAAHRHQQSAQPGLHGGHGARTSTRWRGIERATGPSPCWPTKSTNTCSTTGACTSPS